METKSEKKEFCWDYYPITRWAKLTQLEREKEKSKILLSHNLEQGIHNVVTRNLGGRVYDSYSRSIITGESKRFTWSESPLIVIEFWFPREPNSIRDYYKSPRVSVEYIGDSVPRDIQDEVTEAMNQDFLGFLKFYQEQKRDRIINLGWTGHHTNFSIGYKRFLEDLRGIISATKKYNLDNEIIEDAENLFGFPTELMEML